MSAAFPTLCVISLHIHISVNAVIREHVTTTTPDPSGPEGMLPSGPSFDEYPYS
jgi:hypothetical protein